MRSILSRGWIVLICLAVGIGLATARASTQAKMYASEAVVRVVNPDRASVIGSSGRVDPAREVDIQALYARSPAIRASVEESLDIQLGDGNRVRVTGLPNVDAIRIRAESTDRTRAQLVATTYSDAYIKERRTTIAALFQNEAAKLGNEAGDLTRQISDLDKVIAPLVPELSFDAVGRPILPPPSEQVRGLESQRDLLSQRREGLLKQAQQVEFEGAARQQDVAFVDTPRVPQRPFSPKILRDAVLGGALGGFLGVVAALVLGRRDDRLKRTDDLRDLVPAGVPVVGVPIDTRDASERRDTPLVIADGASAGAETFRSLRAKLLFGRNDRHRLSVMVTSPSPGEGKTTVAANLALVTAMTGRRVILVDLDLHRPRIGLLFGIPASHGLSALVRTQAPFAQAAKAVPAGEGCLHVLGSGPPVPNPAELLLSPRSLQWLETIRNAYDVMICDCPPILSVADAVSLAALFDGVVLVSSAGSTRARSVKEALEQIDAQPSPLIGAVLNGVQKGDRTYVHHYGRTDKSAAKVFPRVFPVPNLKLSGPATPPNGGAASRPTGVDQPTTSG